MIPLWLLACATQAPETAAPAPQLAQAEEPVNAAPEELDLGADLIAPDGAERVVIRHILIPYDGAADAPFGWTLTREEARAQADQLLLRVQAGEDFATLARQHSRDPSAPRGGFLGGGQRGSWVTEFEAAAFALPVGGTSGVVETPYGFHILRREPLEEVKLRHAVVQYKGARGVGPDTPAATRTPETARAQAEQILAALESGRPFADVARELSDGPMGPRGGELGWFLRGELGPAFDAVVFELPVGARSAVIETPFGYHIVERVE